LLGSVLAENNLMRAFVILLVFAGAVCASEPKLETDLMALKRSVLTNYARVVSAAYNDSLASAKNLQKAIDVFLAQPSEGSLNLARKAWLDARVPYLQTEVCRFYDGPIDQVEGMINAWPIDENYIDYVAGNPKAGVINAVAKFPHINRELIVSLNEKEGERNISTGFHAIEFLLWGQDMNEAGPGNRSWRDYTDASPNGERRRQYLRIVAALLVEHLATVSAAWAEESSGNYRAEFLTMEPDAALANVLKGMGALSGPELAGERLTVPYETKEQEDEHSCFSDNTCNDVIYDALGIQNIYSGCYRTTAGVRIEGPGVRHLLAAVDRAFADRLAAQIQTSVTCARNIPQPFDRAILGPNSAPGRVAIRQAIRSLQAQSDMIAQAATLLSIKLNLQASARR
jgi:putative iron-regulated protein